MTTTKLSVIVPILLCFLVAGAAGQTLGLSFSQPAQISSTEAPFKWYPDRYPAHSLVASSNVLTESISPADFQTPAMGSETSFYNTQGYKFDVIPGTTSVSILVYIPSTWELLPERLAGFWATAVNSTYVVGNDYPIVEFQGPITSELPGPGYYPNGGVAGFYGWDNTANGGNGGWDYIGLPTNFKYNSYVLLTMSLSNGQFTYSVANSAGADGVSITSPLYDPTEAFIGNVILEGYNYNAPNSIKWKTLKASFNSDSQIIWN